MKKSRKYSIVGFLVILSLLTAACAKKADYETTDTASYSDVYDASNYDLNQEAAPAAEDFSEVPKTDDSGGLTSTTGLTSDITSVQPQEKIIRTFYMDVETQEFDSLITKIGSEITRLGGYVESSQVNGKKYYYEDQARYGSIIARIPSDKADEFVNTVDENENANVINKQESSKNVSLEYIDTKSRIETLEIEQDRLFAILDKEISLENIITLESRLSDIRYELQNYESQIRYYDNLVAYSTVTMNIQEVEKLTPVTETKQTVGTRIKNGFSNTMYHLSEGLKNFFVWFVVNLPYLLIWAIIIAAAWFIIRRTMKKSKAKAEKQILPPPPVFFGGPQNMGQQYQNPMNQNQVNQNPMNQNQPNQNRVEQSQPPQNNQDQN